MIKTIPFPQKVSAEGGFINAYGAKKIYNLDGSIPTEGYRLSVKEGEIVFSYSDDAGKFYAGVTLDSITVDGKIPVCEIEDAPRFGYRAFMLDSSRHFQSVDEVKCLIKAASMLKLNFFHWHLSDDHGFRFESEKYPLLNEIGSYRDSIGFGSKEEGIYGGYFTKDEIREVVELCNSLHMEVIPAIDIPGHATDLISSYPELCCRDDKVSVGLEAGVMDNILCPGKESVFEFCFNLLGEVAELFPCKYFHIGGDEVPKKNWKKCPECQARIKSEGLKNEEELQGYFTKRIAGYLESIGKTPIVWNDALRSGMLGSDIVVCQWDDPKNKVVDFAKKGGLVISEKTSNNYLDYTYEHLPMKRCYDYDIVPLGTDAKTEENFIGVEAPIWTEWIPNFSRLSFQAFPRLMAVAENGWTLRENKDYDRFKKNVEIYAEHFAKMGIEIAPKEVWDAGLKRSERK